MVISNEVLDHMLGRLGMNPPGILRYLALLVPAVVAVIRDLAQQPTHPIQIETLDHGLVIEAHLHPDRHATTIEELRRLVCAPNRPPCLPCGLRNILLLRRELLA